MTEKILKEAGYPLLDINIIMSVGDIETKRLIAEAYYDKAEELFNLDNRKTKQLKAAKKIYSEIMTAYERVYP